MRTNIGRRLVIGRVYTGHENLQSPTHVLSSENRFWKGESVSSMPTTAHDAASALRSTLEALHTLDPVTLGHLDAVAETLTRVAVADDGICDVETSRMEELLIAEGGLTEAVAVLLVELARQRCEHRDCATAYTVTRGLRQSTTPELRRRLVSAMLDVAAADGTSSPTEIETVRRIACELGVGLD